MTYIFTALAILYAISTIVTVYYWLTEWRHKWLFADNPVQWCIVLVVTVTPLNLMILTDLVISYLLEKYEQKN